MNWVYKSVWKAGVGVILGNVGVEGKGSFVCKGLGRSTGVEKSDFYELC